MNVIRPVREADLDQMMKLAERASFGLTSLPKDRELLGKRIAESELGFQRGAEKPGGELYLFVMEDLDQGRIIGTSAIVSKVGGFEPFYAYEIRVTVHESETLGVHKEIETLHLVREHSGPSEIGGLFLAPDYREHGNGRLLSLFRFLFMAANRERFESKIIAEMRGVVDEGGRSPFWEAIGHHFFDIDFPKADYLSLKDKRFIADLMPTCPIYIPLLPKAAQDVIGEVHEKTLPAVKMLRDEGLRHAGMVDIFEAGPVLSCRLDEVRIVKECERRVVREIGPEESESRKFIITNRAREFRACMGRPAPVDFEGVRVSAETAGTLNVRVGDEVMFGPLHPRSPEEVERP